MWTLQEGRQDRQETDCGALVECNLPSSILFRLGLVFAFPRHAGAQVVADKFPLLAVASATAVLVEDILRDIFHHLQHLGRVIEVLAVGAELTLGLLRLDLPADGHLLPVLGVGASRANRTKRPVLGAVVAVLLVLFLGDWLHLGVSGKINCE